jgi:hypothetical protein
MLYKLFALALLLLAPAACAPIGWFVLLPTFSVTSTPPAVLSIEDGAVTPDQATQLPAPTGQASPAVTSAPGSNGSLQGWKTYTSDRYQYSVKYPADWTMNVQTPGLGYDPEFVDLRPSAIGLPAVQIYALKGEPPITGFENCVKNLVFRGTQACSISLPKGQAPGQQLLVFQRGESYYLIGIQYENQEQLGVFEDIVKSFQFTQ